MKITQRIKNYAPLALGLCLLGAGMTGCIKDEYGARETTTVRLTVSTRSDYEDQNNQPGHNLELNEEMKTLRVIVARSSNNEIIYNWYEDNIADNDFERTINFSELTILTTGENFDFYAIANEAGFLNDGESLEGKSVDLDALKSRILENDFNAADAGQIPQTAFATQRVVPGTNDDLVMQLKFVVAKIDLTFTNQSVSSIDLSDISFSHMNVATTPLFPVETLSDAGSVLSLDDMSVPGGGSANKVVYVYESQIGSSENYTLSAAWGRNTKSLDLTAGGLGRTFSRGTKLQINVTLNAEQEVDDLDILVSAWDEKNMVVPPFE